MSAFQIRHHHNLAPRAKSVERKVRSQPLKKNKQKKKQVYHPVSSVKCARSPEKKKEQKKEQNISPNVDRKVR